MAFKPGNHTSVPHTKHPSNGGKAQPMSIVKQPGSGHGPVPPVMQNPMTPHNGVPKC